MPLLMSFNKMTRRGNNEYLFSFYAHLQPADNVSFTRRHVALFMLLAAPFWGAVGLLDGVFTRRRIYAKTT